MVGPGGAPVDVLAVLLLLWWLKRKQIWLREGELRAWRERRGLTQEEVVQVINNRLPADKGIDKRTYERWERGESQPHVGNYRALMQARSMPKWDNPVPDPPPPSMGGRSRRGEDW